MTENVYWLLEVAIKPGQYETLKALMEEMVESTRKEPGALIYEWHVSADKSTCHIYERYVDSAAVLAHLAAINDKFMPRFMGAVEPKRMQVYGSPNDAVKEAGAGFGAELFETWGGFMR